MPVSSPEPIAHYPSSDVGSVYGVPQVLEIGDVWVERGMI